MAIYNLIPEMDDEMKALQEEFPRLDFEAFVVDGAMQVVATDPGDRHSATVAGGVAELRAKLAKIPPQRS